MNTKDFYNLINVYMDAVFHPRAIDDPQVLQQEGWHYELEDPSKPLTYKGVVYNEMKGVYSSPESIMGTAVQNALFPDNTYRVDSGGDPRVIPSLTFDQFKSFHASYYHPANSRLYFYGDDDPLKRLELMDEYLSEFDAVSVQSQIAPQPLNLTPKKLTLPFPISPEQPPKHITTVNWLLNEAPLSPVESMALTVLDHLLMGTSASVLRKVLTESGLGESVTGGGLSDELRQATFGVGLKGVKKENVEKVEELVLSTLRQVSESGFDAEAVRASINSVEFRLREFNTGSFPRGLSLMLGMLNHWLYERGPFDGVRFEEALSTLKKDLADGQPVFQNLLKRLLVDNVHRVTVDMTPDTTLEAKMEEEEANRLAEIKAAMSPEQLQLVMDTAKILREAQEKEDSPEAKATLPSLSREDLDRKSREIPSTQEAAAAGGVTLVLTPVQSNGILYTDIGFDMTGVALEDLPLLPLLSRMLMESGTETMDEVALSRQIGAETGGISIAVHTDLKEKSGVVSDPNDVIALLLVRGKATTDKASALFGLVEEVLLRAKLDNQRRALEILKESKARRESSVVSSGHSYAATRLGARYSLLGYMGEVMGGVTAISSTAKLLEQAEKDWPSVQSRLESLRDRIVRRGPGSVGSGGNRLAVSLSGEAAVLAATRAAAEAFVARLPVAEAAACVSNGPTIADMKTGGAESLLFPAVDEGFVIPSQVNYVVKGGPLFNPGDRVKGSYSVVSRYLSTGYLWDNVRVIGGAYGGFARFSPSSGRFSFMSYRDPNLLNTLNTYDAAADALAAAVKEEAGSATAEAEAEGAGLTPEALLQVVIGTVGEMDSPMSPDQKGFDAFSRYLSGETAEDRQQFRNEVLDTAPEDFAEFAEKLSTLKTSGSVAVFGSESAIAAANKELSQEKQLRVLHVLGGAGN